MSLVQVIEINLSSMVPYVSGPKRPQDRVAISSMKEDFQSCLDEKVTSKEYAANQTHKFMLTEFMEMILSFCALMENLTYFP